jgi:hypothetical protein
MPAELLVSQIEAEIAASALYAAGGFTVASALFSDSEMAELRGEASIARLTGSRQEFGEFVPCEGRGGSPKRAFLSAQGGQTQWRLFNSPHLLASIQRATGLTVKPTGSGSYSYYECEGDFLALHRDIETCDLAVITCIDENSISSGGGRLLVYPQHMHQPLSAAHLAGPSAATAVWLRRGNTILLLGGMVPHELAPTKRGEQRVVSVMCFQTLTSAPPFGQQPLSYTTRD